jgi:hypothetical protein
MARHHGTRRTRRRRGTSTYRDNLAQQQRWFLPDESIFSSLRRHGNTKCKPLHLVWLAVLCFWSDAPVLADAFSEALRHCRALFGCLPVGTYQGFMAALLGRTAQMMPPLRRLVHRRLEQAGGRFWRSGGWVAIAFDGSRSTAPRTRSAEDAFCARTYGAGPTAKYRKKKSKGMRRRRNQARPAAAPEPQMWITLMWHVGLRLPWCWRLGPSNASERADVMDMLGSESFPRDTLFCGDAGFVGYPLWSRIVGTGRHFLVRVGANVNLLTRQHNCTLPAHGNERLVLCWPKEAQRNGQEPLRLRLVRLRVGKTPMWLLTDVVDRQRLTLKAMRRLYQRRWGIEVELRGLKQTLRRGKLRCRTAARLLVEMDWSILAMTIAELLAIKEQQAGRAARRRDRGAVIDPVKRSLAKTLRALREGLQRLGEVVQAGQDLRRQLREAQTDNYQRKGPKRARYRRANPDKKPLGHPEIRPLRPEERQRLRQLGTKTSP